MSKGSQSGGHGVDRDQLERLVEAGMTIAQMAHELGKCTATVRLWLARHGLQTHATRRIAQIRAGRADGRATLTLKCAVHGESEFVIEGSGYYRCKRCRYAAVTRRRKKLKETLVADAGGQCCVCGYSRCIAALEFHHLDRSQKRLQISQNGVTLSLEVLRAEAAKCILVCSNCHAEIENGATQLPIELSGTWPD